MDNSTGTRPLFWTLIAPVCNEQVLASTLLQSPVIDPHCELILKRNYGSAAHAFNEALREAMGEVIVLAHQDVYLPAGWLESVARAIQKVEALDPNWGVLGTVGVRPDGYIDGYVYSTGLGGFVGGPFEDPIESLSLDEMVLVLRRSAELRFDEGLPGFHLYGTDICLEAARRGLKNYIVPAPCLHNSNGLSRLPREFWRGYLYLRRKWRAQLPIRTCCVRITPGCVPMLRKTVRGWLNTLSGRYPVGRRHEDPGLFYRETLSGRLEGLTRV